MQWRVLGIGLLATSATIGAIAITSWLAGAFFFLLSGSLPHDITLQTWWTYAHHYLNHPTAGFRLKAAMIAAVMVCLVAPLGIAFAAIRKKRSLHGDARFASAAEIARANLHGSDGIIIGKARGRYLLFPGMQFVLLAAPTRSGKGVGVVIPNLLHWPDSAVVFDIKLENFKITSGYRRLCGQDVFLFNPFSITESPDGNPLEGKSHRYNPLGYVSTDRRLRIQDILSIGYALYPGEGKEAFFDDAARNLFLALVLYLLETPDLPRTMGELLRQSSGKGKPIREHLQGLINSRNFREVSEVSDTGVVTTRLEPRGDWDGVGLPPLSDECVDAINRFTSTSDNTLSSILATFNVPLTVWASPVVDAATSANDFDLREIRKRRMTLYVGIPARRLDEAKLILNLIYTQLINLSTNQLLNETPELKYMCLVLGDEFTAAGRIGIIDKSNAFIAGYGLRLLTIIQSPGQLEAPAPRGYGKEGARTLMTNHACQILYTPREQKDANEYSEMLGYETFKSRGTSKQSGPKSSHGESFSDQRRALMLPQELKELSQRKQVVVLENTKPILADKIAYYEDAVFIDRLKLVSPSLQALGKRLPSRGKLESVWRSGELASPVPALDLDAHTARVERRIRALTDADVADGIDLDRLTVDAKGFAKAAGDTGAPVEDVERIVGEFFDAIERTSADIALPRRNDFDEFDIDEDGAALMPVDTLDSDPSAFTASEADWWAVSASDQPQIPGGDDADPVAKTDPVHIDLTVLDRPAPSLKE